MHGGLPRGQGGGHDDDARCLCSRYARSARAGRFLPRPAGLGGSGAGARMGPTAGSGTGAPSLSFQLEADHTPPVWPQRPGTQQMQAHVDVQVDDLDAETERACALGATLEEHQPQTDVRVLRDPHGHLFCLFLPGA
ncbi:VOC family protein [Streptomyces albidochromogenes]|uniref:VOC family protein n=1 Tax=Streptomyces albidochromogenes TaxID=329524 RepID=A0ABW6FHD6_9ACTN